LLQEKGVGLINASPLSMGLLTMRGAPEWHPAPDEIRNACQRAANICRNGGTSLEKLAIQYSVSNKSIPTTLVSTARPENIKKNIRWTEEVLNQELLEDVLNELSPIHNLTW